MAKFSNWSHENLAKFAQAATQKMLERPMTDALKMVQEQAEDAALWCKAATATEAHLQQALRWLHYAVEQSQADRAELLEAQAAPAPVPGMTDELREAATAAMKGLADARRDEDCELPIQLLDALEDVASTLIADLAIGAAGRAPAPTALDDPRYIQARGGTVLPAEAQAEPVAWLEEAAWGRSLHLTKPDYGQAKWRAPAPKLTPLYTFPTGEPTPEAALQKLADLSQQMGGEL